MTPILGIWASSAQPAAFAGSFESIATVTVGAGGSATIDFTSIPGTYTHLQLRFLIGSARATTGYSSARISFNSDSGSNYASHRLYGNGTSASADAQTSQVATYSVYYPNGNKSYFGVAVLDILDYANTNKYKTIRALSGIDDNNADGAGIIGLQSGLWMSTSVITSISIAEGSYSNNFAQYSKVSLYGIKSS